MEIENFFFLIYIFILLHYLTLNFNNLNLLHLTVPVLLPLNIYRDLLNPHEFRKELKKVGGVYGLFHLKDGKQYIGSSLNLYDRLTDHLRGVSSNIRLQRSISKSGLSNFVFVIYYYHKDPFVILTDMETEIINSFPFEDLYNFKKDAKSMLGYKHTAEAIEKMRHRLADKTNHPMYGKKHSLEAIELIRKPGELNPMFNKTHSNETRKKISVSLSKTPLGLYDINNKLINTYVNQVELATELSCFKTTISRYIISEKLFKGKYYIRKL